MREHQTPLTRVDPGRTRPVQSPIFERVGSQGGCPQERIGRLSDGAVGTRPLEWRKHTLGLTY
jgi:hypothetical protein